MYMLYTHDLTLKNIHSRNNHDMNLHNVYSCAKIYRLYFIYMYINIYNIINIIHNNIMYLYPLLTTRYVSSDHTTRMQGWSIKAKLLTGMFMG